MLRPIQQRSEAYIEASLRDKNLMGEHSFSADEGLT